MWGYEAERHVNRAIPATILIVDDQAIVREAVVRYLQREGFATLVATGGEQATALAPAADLLILDLMLPKVDGIEVCRRVRESAITPIIMLTAKGRIKDKLAGLAAGADDYVVKPFSLAELAARARVALRRVQPGLWVDAVIEIGELRIDARSRIAERSGTTLDMTDREMDLLLFLARHAGQTLPGNSYSIECGMVRS